MDRFDFSYEIDGSKCTPDIFPENSILSMKAYTYTEVISDPDLHKQFLNKYTGK